MLNNLEKYNIVLASGSPRRKELLQRLGINFKVRTLLGIDESYPNGLHGDEAAMHIARNKAKAYALTMEKNDLIITADTIVYTDNQIFGKPQSVDRAKFMLHYLAGKEHQVSTGVCVFSHNKTKEFVVTSSVEFANLTDEEINYYVDKFVPIDKAGGYGVQDWIGMAGIKSIQGSFYNVVGLPMQRLYDCLKTF